MALKQSRRLDPLEQVFRLWKGFLFAGVEYEKPGYTENAVNELIRTNSAFHTKLSLLSIHTTKCEPHVVKIPRELKTLDAVTSWMYKNHQPNPRKTLGSIAYDDTRVVVCTSHICGDGVHNARMIEHLCNPDEKWPDAVLPESSTHNFSDQIFCEKWKKSHPIVCGNDTKVTRLMPQRKPASDKEAEYLAEIIRMPIEELACYNPSTKKCHAISEAQWLANALTAAAFNDKIDPFGISTAYDLRKVLPPNRANSPEIQNYIASVLVDAKPTPTMTLGDLSKAMRTRFQKNDANQDYFGHMYNVWEVVFRPWRPKSQKGLGMEVSSIGPIRIKSPVKDAWLVLRSPDNYPLSTTSLLSFSLFGPEKKEFIGTFEYCTKELNKLDGFKITRSIEFCLRNLKDNMTVKEAIDFIKAYQKTLP